MSIYSLNPKYYILTEQCGSGGRKLTKVEVEPVLFITRDKLGNMGIECSQHGLLDIVMYDPEADTQLATCPCCSLSVQWVETEDVLDAERRDLIDDGVTG